MKLRPYQSDLLDRAADALRQYPRVLVQAPTGAGKTAMAAHMVGGAARRGLRIYFLCHRIELIRQSSAAFDAQSIPHGVIAPGFVSTPHAPVQVASIQTLARRLGTLAPPDFVIIDECHHAASKTWAATIEALRPRWIIGLSATPCRLDGAGLDAHFDKLVPGPAVADLIDGGFLSPFRIYAPTTMDMTGVRTTAGDYNRSDTANAAAKITGDAVEHYKRLAPGKRAVVFCCAIRHAEQVAADFNAAGIRAESIDGKMKPGDRAAALRRFASGETLILTSVDLVSEGFDLPAIECAISLRPTKSLSLWIQQVGRVLRTAPGKTEAVILDHAGNALRHGLPDDPREWTLAGRKKRARKVEAEFPVKQCPECFHVHHPAPVCPGCGHVYEVKGRKLEYADGELQELKRGGLTVRDIQSAARKAKSLEELKAIAAKAGYAPGWAWHAWQRKQAGSRKPAFSGATA